MSSSSSSSVSVRPSSLIRVGVVGCGPSSWIGQVHLRALKLDARFNVVAGNFSRDKEKNEEQAHAVGVSLSRTYDDYKVMAATESALDKNNRIQLVVVVTPNSTHKDVVSCFLSYGVFHVACDKPLSTSLSECIAIRDVLFKVNNINININSNINVDNINNLTKTCLLAVTHNYSGYPMAKQARHLILSGSLGVITKVQVEYSQGWLTPKHALAHAHAEQNTTMTSSSGISSIVDVGTHAYHLLRYLCGSSFLLDSVFADISTFSNGQHRQADNFDVLLRFKQGARGVLTAAQSSVGSGNDLNIRVFGSLGSLEWHQEQEPNVLTVKRQNKPIETWRRAEKYLCKAALNACRLPDGHPEGYIEAFASLYSSLAAGINRLEPGNVGSEVDPEDFPNINDAIESQLFVDAVIKSHNDEKWTEINRNI